MTPTQQEVEALACEMHQIWCGDDGVTTAIIFNRIARHVLAHHAPPGTIRLGTGLTEEQMSWTTEGKRDMAAKYDAVAAALTSFSWAATAEGAQWKAVRNRFSQMAEGLRAAAEPLPDPRIAVVQGALDKMFQHPVSVGKDRARAILAALDKMGDNNV